MTKSTTRLIVLGNLGKSKSGKAIKFRFAADGFATEQWLPTSQVTIVNTCRIDVPTWLAEKKGLLQFAEVAEVVESVGEKAIREGMAAIFPVAVQDEADYV